MAGRRRKFTNLWPINAVSITFHILFSALAISCVLVVVVFNRQHSAVRECKQKPITTENASLLFR